MFKKLIIIGVSCLFIICYLPSVGQGEEGGFTYFDYGFKEFGLFSGFYRGKLKEKKDYEVIAAMLRFGFDLRPLIKNKSNVLFEFMLEPFINTVISPDNNVEIGNNFLFKFGIPVYRRFYPYIQLGVGVIYLTQHAREQGTQFNFSEQGEAGVTYFFKKNLCFNLGYRVRHISNLSIKRPNSGIDSGAVIFGLSCLY